MTIAHVFAFLLSALLGGSGAQVATGPAGVQTRSAPAISQDVLYCVEPVYDFGEAWAGDIVEHSFQVTNRSDKVVLLEAVPTCHCTSTKRNYRIEPHQTIPIKVRFDTHGRNGETGSSITLRVTGLQKP
jgi:hypothetical protein